MNHEKLRAKLGQSEDPWVERKESFQADKILKTLVGLANSVPQGEEAAVLFIGASNSGKHPGVMDADGAQKEINSLVKSRAYPEIIISMTVFSVLVDGNSKEILAVVIPASKQKPHFSGAAWVRKGSETVRASAEMFEELIASRHETVRVLQKHKGNRIALSMVSKPTKLRIEFWEGHLQEVSAKTVKVDTNEGGYHTFGIDSVEIVHEMPALLQIEGPSPWTEAEHIQKMIMRWATTNPDANGIERSRTSYLADQLLSNLPVTLNLIRWEAKRSPTKALRVLHSNAEMIAREMKLA
jgi:hypothetical protein